jgi:hypothetical protein
MCVVCVSVVCVCVCVCVCVTERERERVCVYMCVCVCVCVDKHICMYPDACACVVGARYEDSDDGNVRHGEIRSPRTACLDMRMKNLGDLTMYPT